MPVGTLADIPDPTGARDAAEFVALLAALRRWSGQPSLRTLQRLAGRVQTAAGAEVTALPPTTTSWVLTGKGLPKLPRLEFVDLYVATCLRACGQPDSVIIAEVHRWRSAWRRLAGTPVGGTSPGLRLNPTLLMGTDEATSTEPLPDPESAAPAPPAPSSAYPPQPIPAAPALRTPVSAPLTPTQLPAATPHFWGRHRQLAELDRLSDLMQESSTVVIATIAGTAGVGKTTLAVEWAHRAAARFPDGQLYVNLRGFAGTGPPTCAHEVVRGFLDALGVPPQQMPASHDAQVGLYRSLLAGRRVLLLLDNARDAEQVRPLLPGGPGCLVLVTSRRRLASLVAAEGAHPIVLDVPPAEEARCLLAARLGADRIATEPQAADDIVKACGRLPLALAVVGARAAIHPGFSLRTLADELQVSRDRLDTLSCGDAATDVRAAFSWSYQALPEEHARLFRLLTLHPGPDISAPAAASLIGTTVRRVRWLLADLTGGHLITERRPGRYELHDLLRDYGNELAHTFDSEVDRRSAIKRMLDHYLRTADAATMLLNPHWERMTPDADEPSADPDEFPNHAAALNWFTTERPVLLAAVKQAAAEGFESYAWHLAWTLIPFLDLRGHWADWEFTQRIALAVAQRTGDRLRAAHSHRGLARACLFLDRNDDALNHLRQAMQLYRELDDRVGLASTHRNLGHVFELRGDRGQALHHASAALDLYRMVGDRVGEARTLNAVGWCLAQIGDYEQALAYCQKALALQQEINHRFAQADTWDSLGYVHHQLGNSQQAIACYHQAVTIYRELGERLGEAHSLVRYADLLRDAGDLAAARSAWQRALDTLDELGHPDSARVRAKLCPAAPDGRPRA